VGSRDALVPKSPHPVVVDAGARAPIRRLGALVDLQVGIGLTTAALKYTVILSGTHRFGVPGL
jgi:hypothetical protein